MEMSKLINVRLFGLMCTTNIYIAILSKTLIKKSYMIYLCKISISNL